jgi:hypothetical protein
MEGSLERFEKRVLARCRGSPNGLQNKTGIGLRGCSWLGEVVEVLEVSIIFTDVCTLPIRRLGTRSLQSTLANSAFSPFFVQTALLQAKSRASQSTARPVPKLLWSGAYPARLFRTLSSLICSRPSANQFGGAPCFGEAVLELHKQPNGQESFKPTNTIFSSSSSA